MVVYNPYDWKVHEDPYPSYRALRDEAPAYYNEELDFWALSRHQDVLEAFRDPVTYSSGCGVSLEQNQVDDATAVMSFLAMDPPQHDRLRLLVSRGFTPRRVSALEFRIRQIATQYIDSFIEKGQCEFIGEFAGKLPMDVISEMLGVPAEDRDRLRIWADLVLHREPGVAEVPQAGMQAAAKLLGYFSEHVGRRHEHPGDDDLTDALIAAEVDGDRLADRDVIAFLFLMVIAGNETTTKLLGNALYWISKHPGERAKLNADASLISGWAEETLRFDPSSQLIARTTTRDVELHGRKVPEGARIALLIGSANRDERVFDRADEYDIRRDTSQSLAFGQGTHFCLGASLARLEARVALEEIRRRLPAFEIRFDALTRVHSSSVRGFAQLPIRFPVGRRLAAASGAGEPGR